LANEELYDAILQERGILYAPYFLINAGGVINVYAELAHYGKEEIMRKTENTYNITLDIIDYIVANGITTHHAPLAIAQNRIDHRKVEKGKK
jgi:leucine dehydrogenase